MIITQPAGAPGIIVPAGKPQSVTYAPPRAVAPLSWSWTSWDGTTWDLTDLNSPVIKLAGASGVGLVSPEHNWTDAVSVPGSNWEDAHIGRGSVFLPVRVQGKDSLDFLKQHQKFMRSMDPKKEGILEITRPDGQVRSIACRYESGLGDAVMDRDPVMQGFVQYGITFVTADPFWSGDSVHQEFGNADPVALFPGPPFVINNSRTFASARFTNLGDQESYAFWRVHGPFTSFSVGLGESVVTLSLTKGTGEYIEIDQAPRKRTIVDQNGSDFWLSATAADFAGIPPGVNLPLSVRVYGTTTDSYVELDFTPKFSSLWT